MAASSPHAVARRLFKWAFGNQERTAAIDTAFDAAMTGALSKGGLNNLSSSSKNAISITMQQGMSEPDRQMALELARDWLAAGIMPSNRGRVGFF
jgi:hypothetical protein